MTKQMLAVCDDTGTFSGYFLDREKAHRPDAPRHLAVVVLLVGGAGSVLLQKRKHQLFDNVLDLTAATHVLRHTENSHETFEHAGARSLEREYGLREIGLRVAGAFNYRAADGALCEHEHCVVLIGGYEGQVVVNPAVAYGCEWREWRELLSDIEAQPLWFTPWAREAMAMLSQGSFFLSTSPESTIK